MTLELRPDQVRKKFDPDSLGFGDTKELDGLNGIIGQDRAVNAMEFGLHMRGNGFNMYVAGPPGIGKMTSVKAFIEEVAQSKDTPDDLCYVNNFDDSYSPLSIKLPSGKGCELQKDMEEFVERVRAELPRAFESDEYTARRDELMNELNRRREDISKEVSEKAEREDLSIRPSPMGVLIVPTKEGKALGDEEYQELSEEEKEKIQKQREEVQSDMKAAMKDVRKLEQETQERIKELDRNVALNTVGGLIDDLEEKYSEYEKVTEFLEAVQGDMLDNLDMFKGDAGQPRGEQQQQAHPQLKKQQQAAEELTLRKYEVNVLVDNCKADGAPVIMEYNPTYNNLVGRIEKEMKMGALTTDFTMIRPGSIPRANGGFLVLPVEDVLMSPFSYDELKRTLRSNKIPIEDIGERLGFMTVKTIRPEPIPIDVKVVLVGSPLIFYLLQAYDEEFQELFKVKVDFDTRMELNEGNLKEFMSFISTFCSKEELKHLDRDAVAKVAEHALRMTDDQERLSIKFGLLSDLLREADFWAGKDGSDHVGAEHVKRALDEKIYRSNLLEERIREMVERGTILIDTEGETTGQVNGLSVIDLGNYRFGRPNRITATVGPGRDGIVDIEREANLGGPIHSKGVMILSGYIDRKYSDGRPVTLASKLVFEQSYQGVEGDSASSAELYAILSELAAVPIKQNIAVTGSVNQHGQVQAIGAVNQKIEGFFDVCRVKGLTGEQGVVIPESNRKNLMLRDDVVEAIGEGKFHVWAVSTIDEGIGVLTGLRAGEKETDGTFEDGSVNERVRLRLRDFEDTMKEFREPAGKELEKESV